MKITSRVMGALGSAALLATLGCAICTTTEDVRKAGQLEIVNTIPADKPPADTPTGYVEFYSVSRHAVVPIYLLDAQHRARLLGATGLKKGEAYSFTRHQTTVAEKVRVAVAPGTHQFMIERDGQLVEVRVEADKVTPVEIDYVIYDRADNYVIYRVDYQTFEPMPLKAKSG